MDKTIDDERLNLWPAPRALLTINLSILWIKLSLVSNAPCPNKHYMKDSLVVRRQFMQAPGGEKWINL